MNERITDVSYDWTNVFRCA